MNGDGSDQHPIGDTGPALQFDVSTDGKWLVYETVRDRKCVIYRKPLAGGPATPLAECYLSGVPVRVSPDGKWVAFRDFDQSTFVGVVDVLPLLGGEIFRTQGPSISSDELFQTIQWSSDSKTLFFSHTENGVGNIWSLQALPSRAGNLPKQLTHFANQQIYDFAFSRDEKRIALSRGIHSSDAVLIRISQ